MLSLGLEERGAGERLLLLRLGERLGFLSRERMGLRRGERLDLRSRLDLRGGERLDLRSRLALRRGEGLGLLRGDLLLRSRCLGGDLVLDRDLSLESFMIRDL